MLKISRALPRTRLAQALCLSLPLLAPLAVAQTQVPSTPTDQQAALPLGPLRVQGQGGKGPELHPSDKKAERAPYVEPGSSVYVGRAALERFRGTSTADMLKGLAGVQMGDVRNGQALDVNIRGLQGQSRVPVLVDGAQQSLDVYRGYAGQQQRSYLDPDLISSVRVDKGPQLDPGLSGAIGGAVSMSTLRVDDVLLPGQAQGVRLRGGFSDNAVSPQPGHMVWNRKNDRGLDDPANFSASVAFAKRHEQWDFLAAYAQRKQGNFLAGMRGSEDYDKAQREPDGTARPGEAVSYYYRAGEEVLNTHSRSESLLVKATLKQQKDAALELSYRYFDTTFGEVMPSNISRQKPSSKRVKYVNPPDAMFQYDPSQMRLHALTAAYRIKPAGQDLIDLKTKAWFTQADSLMFNSCICNTPFFYDVPPGQSPDSMGADYAAALASSVSATRWGADIANTSRWFTEAGDWTLSYGAAVERMRTGPGKNSPVLEVDTRNNRYIRSGERQEASLVAALKWQPIAPLSLSFGGRYSEAESLDHNRTAHVTGWQTFKNRWVKLTKDGKPLSGKGLGGGYSAWNADAKGNFTPESLRATPYMRGVVGDLDFDAFSDATRPYDDKRPSAWRYGEPLKRNTSAFAPTLKASYQFTPATMGYVSVATGVKLPNIFESTLGIAYAAPVKDLRPERNKSFDIGLSSVGQNLWAEGDSGAVKLAYFNNKVSQFITRVVDLDTYNFTIQNIDSFKSSGLEFQSQYESGIWNAGLSATYYNKVQSCDAAGAKRLRESESVDHYGTQNTPDCVSGGFGASYTNNQNPPKYAINLNLGARLLEQRLELTTRVTHNSAPHSRLTEAWHTAAGTTIQQFTPAHTVVDVSAQYRLGKATSVQLSVENLANRYYQDALAQSPLPGPGRTTRVTFTTQF